MINGCATKERIIEIPDGSTKRQLDWAKLAEVAEKSSGDEEEEVADEKVEKKEGDWVGTISAIGGVKNGALASLGLPLLPFFLIAKAFQLTKEALSSNHTEVTVWYATDRKPSEGGPEHFYGSDRGSVSYGTLIVTIPKTTVRRVGKPRLVEIRVHQRPKQTYGSGGCNTRHKR